MFSDPYFPNIFRFTQPLTQCFLSTSVSEHNIGWSTMVADKELTMEEAHHLSSRQTLASEEFLLKDDNPMLKQNLTTLLRKIMQEDSSTWDALCSLDQMKASNPGFDYRVKYDHYGRPEAVCWMLPEIHGDLIRFGNCLFLDSQKRQYNVVGWPYISPVVKDSKMQVGCVAEYICLEESHCMYVWIVSILADMEPRYYTFKKSCTRCSQQSWEKDC
jgi:hypothetical protein